ncbi:MAG: pro-sigmaK processing inhibitor BofA family protein [Clostridia bacterium]|nr:pro-sigmaK processing inhibitor BofA family protein [Clostridia bacterium]
MKIIAVLTMIWLSLCSLVLLFLHIKSHAFFKSIIINALLGFFAVALINLTQKFTGVFVPINWYTVIGSGTLGLPCVCGLILAQIII